MTMPLPRVTAVTKCGYCGHDPACGFAEDRGVRLCHTDDHSCYHRWTVYGERRPASVPRDYNVCLQSRDGTHRPEASTPYYNETTGRMELQVQCDVCGITTGIDMPNDIEWN